MIGIFIFLQSLLLAVVARIIYRRYFHPLAIYPGPVFASFTNLWRFNIFFAGDHHLVEQSLHEKYGPIVRTGPNSLSFSSLAAFSTIYGFNGHFEKGPFYSFGRDEKTQEESIFTARSDAAHREHRKKVVGPALTTSKISAYEPVVKKHIADLIAQIEKAKSSDQKSDNVDVPELIHRFTFNTMLEVIYGPQLSPEPYTNLASANKALDSFRAISKFSIATALLPWFQWLTSFPAIQAKIRKPTYNTDGSMNGISALVCRTRTLLSSDTTQILNSPQSSILQNYLRLRKDDARAMDAEQMWRESFNLVFAGPGSTAAALTAVLYELAVHDEWQEKILSEERETEQTESKRASLQAVIKESLRLHAPFPTAFPRDITPGAESAIPGLRAPLPVGTVVAANTYVLGRSKEIWGLDADEWRPERWIVGAEGMESEKWLDERFVVFSKGARGCIGKEIALMLLSDATLRVLTRFRLQKRGELRGSSFLEMQYVQAGIGFVDR